MSSSLKLNILKTMMKKIYQIVNNLSTAKINSEKLQHLLRVCVGYCSIEKHFFESSASFIID